MEKLVSSWSNVTILPENYTFPLGKRPGDQVPISNSIPVIDLAKAEGDDRANIIHQIIEAAHEFGFFQVINHGLPTRLMDDTRDVIKEFFELPAVEKSSLLSWDVDGNCSLMTSNIDYESEEIHNWRDSLRLKCTPLEECIQYWPQQPPRFREIVEEYFLKGREMGSRLLELIGEGLGLESGFFTKELSGDPFLFIHHYPPCPEPSKSLGTRKHCDYGLLTILLQGNVPGLQVVNKDGKWIGVEAIPDAFVINCGHLLQIISNGKLRSVEHRAVTNKKETRNSVGLFMTPPKDCIVQPAKAVLNAQNPPIYKPVTYGDFFNTFRASYLRGTDDVLEPHMVKP